MTAGRQGTVLPAAVTTGGVWGLPRWAWWAIGLGGVALMGVTRFWMYPDQIVPLTYALPLLVCLFCRDRFLLWAMVFASLTMVAIRFGITLPTYEAKSVFGLMQVVNILVPAAAVQYAILLGERVESAALALERSNAELEASNEELAAREEEISQQNEELQSQAEELEQQMVELNAQTEELQTLNEQLAARESTLHDLVEASSLEGSEAEILAALGEMVPRLFGSRACAAAVLEPVGDRMIVRPLFGLAAKDARGEQFRLRRERTLGDLVMSRDRAAYLPDLDLRPDLEIPLGTSGLKLRSVVSAPLRVGETLGGAMEVYSAEKGDWSEGDVRLVQWLAEQCGRLWTSARLRDELAAGRDELERQHTLVQTITDNASAALILTDERGVCTYLNPAAERMLGVALEDARGRSLSWVAYGDDTASKAAELDGFAGQRPLRAIPLPEEGLRVLEDVFRSPANQPGGTPVQVAVRTIMQRGRAVGAVIEARDIGDQKRREREREILLESERSARSEAERASRAKDEFVATLSHELRTPLNAILGWTGLLQRPGAGPDDISKGLEVIERSTRLQSQLISDLLDISRITAGKIRLEVEDLDVGRVVEAAVDSVALAAEAKGVRIQRIIEPLDGAVAGDPGRLQQVVWNLLTNAVKFTPKGGQIRVLVSRVASSVRVVISDTGQGIAPEHLPHVFERYRQADSSSSRKHAGLGLGLSIVKHLVELHGGTVSAHSDGEGKGATFTVLLPFQAVRRADRDGVAPLSGDARPGGDLPSLNGVEIVVAEDEPDAREIIARLLSERGARVRAVGSGTEAVATIRERTPDVLVSDVGMPGMDGYALIRAVRNELGLSQRDLPAVALTAFARSEDRTRVLLAGFQSHVAKPVEAPELVAAVASLAARPGGVRPAIGPDDARQDGQPVA